MFNLFVNYTLAFNIFLFISFHSLYSNDFEDWKSSIISEAIKAGISKKTINQNLQPLVSVNNKVLKLYNNQPEFKISFDSYINRNINEKRIKKGKKLYKKNSKLLDIIFKKYNIPPQIIISIWALESNFGYYTGNFKIVDALATLSFKSRRKSFFKKELFSALRIIDQSLIEANELKGSWAGAMGQSQFMPSSYLSYAVDFNKDNKIDIWRTEADVFASIANYLYKHGWKKNQPWSIEIKEKEIASELDYKKTFTVKELETFNLSNLNLNKFSKNIKAKIKKINAINESKLFLVFDNFAVIKRYNNSDFYALAVGKLANNIEEFK